LLLGALKRTGFQCCHQDRLELETLRIIEDSLALVSGSKANAVEEWWMCWWT